MNVVHYIANQIPGGFREKLKRTPIELLYREYRIRNTNFEYTTFPTPIGDIEMLLPEGDTFSRHAEKQLGHEPALVADLGKSFTRDTTFYDVGSHFGYMIEVALERGVSLSEIHSFESNSFRHRSLQKAYREPINLTRGRVGSISSGTTISLDSYHDDHPTPDIIKMDIEGGEFDALQGATGVLNSAHPQLYIEIHPERLKNLGSSVERVYNLLKSNNYSISEKHRYPDDLEWPKGNQIEDKTAPYHIRAE